MRDIKLEVRDNKLISGIQRLGYPPYEPLSRGCLDFLNNLVAGFSGHSKKNEGRRQNLPVLFRPDLRRSLLPYSTDQTCHRANSDSREGELGSFSWWLHVQRGKNCWSNGALAGHNNSCVPCQRTWALPSQNPSEFHLFMISAWSSGSHCLDQIQVCTSLGTWFLFCSSPMGKPIMVYLTQKTCVFKSTTHLSCNDKLGTG